MEEIHEDHVTAALVKKIRDCTDNNNRFKKSKQRSTTIPSKEKRTPADKQIDKKTAKISPTMDTSDGKKTCLHFLENRCKKGDQCKDLHTKGNDKKSDDRHSKICLYFRRGYCMHGDNCKYSHKIRQDDKHRSDLSGERSTSRSKSPAVSRRNDKLGEMMKEVAQQTESINKTVHFLEEEIKKIKRYRE